MIRMASDKTKGAVPMTVNLTSKGTKDFDRDELKYEWKILSADDKELTTIKDPDGSYTFDKAGVYKTRLTVTDAKGEKATQDIEILAGNEPPVLSFDITRGNQTFFFPKQSFDYEVKVSDKEDGSIGSGITPEEVSVTIDYLPQGYDQVEIAQGHLAADAGTKFLTGKKLMEASDCKSCHFIDKKSIGPMYRDIATKYKDDPKAIDYLAKKIIRGGGGVWGDVNMAAHPQVSVADATEIVKYILNLNEISSSPSLPPNGSYTAEIPKGVSDAGVWIIRAAYTDKGANGLPEIRSEQIKILRSSVVEAGTADQMESVMKLKEPSFPVTLMIGQANKGYVGFNQVDLSGIDQIAFNTMAPQAYQMAGGTIEVRQDSPTGELLGESTVITPTKSKTETPIVVTVNAKIKPATGLHDVFFVFKNEKTAQGQMLFVLLKIQYISNSNRTVAGISMK